MKMENGGNLAKSGIRSRQSRRYETAKRRNPRTVRGLKEDSGGRICLVVLSIIDIQAAYAAERLD
jgi:hypothetical protein